MIGEGDKAPRVTLLTEEGKPVSLADYAGKTIVLFFYPRALTSGCTREACDFRDAGAGLRRKGAVILGISRDSVAAQKKFKEKYGLTYPLLSDPEEKACSAFGVIRDKMMYGRKVRGIERSTFIINDKGIVVKVFRKVKVEGHAAAVLASL